MANEAIDPDTLQELSALMREFPDWKEKFPELYSAINQPIHTRRDVNANTTNGHYHQQETAAYNLASTNNRRVAFSENNNAVNGNSSLAAATSVPAYSRYAPRKVPAISTTTEHYKWRNPDPSLPFCELPTFSNYLIYPGRGRHFQTTNQSFYKGSPGFRQPICKPRDDESMELLGLTSRGGFSVDTSTTTGQAFQAYRDARPAEKIDRTPHDTRYLTRYIDSADTAQIPPPHRNLAGNLVATDERRRLDGTTVTKNDYRAWPIQQRQFYGDRHESPFAASTTRFDGQTTNTMTYRGEQLPGPDIDRTPAAGVVTRPAAGRMNGVSLLDVPERIPRDFDTAYRSDFDRPNGLRLLDKKQVLNLLCELRKRKRKRDEAVAAATGEAAPLKRVGIDVPKVSKKSTGSSKKSLTVPAF